MKDVARAAGVSQTTVSFVLNGVPDHRVPQNTQERVLRAARDLGYTPSKVAQALRLGRTDLVLLILPAIPIGSIVTVLINTLTDELEGLGLHLTTRRLQSNSSVSTLVQGLSPAAVISLDPFPEPDLEWLRSSGVVTIVLEDTREGTAARPGGNERVGAMQVQHLVARGHRHLGYALPRDLLLQTYANPRLDGARHACLSLGLDQPVVVDLDLDVDSAVRAVQQLRQHEPPITAVCVYNDDYAFAILAGLRALHLVAPDDLAVIGCDNVPLAPLACPPLTTIDLNMPIMAANLARSISVALTGNAVSAPTITENITLRVRDSA